MSYALYTKPKGTVLRNDDIGELPGGVAVLIDERQVNIAKHLIDVVVFDRIAGINDEKVRKNLDERDKRGGFDDKSNSSTNTI